MQPQPAVTTFAPVRGSFVGGDRRAGLPRREPDDSDVVAVVDAEGERVGDAVAERLDPRRFRPVGRVGTDDGDEASRRKRATQCAAVRTMSGSTSVPPQRWSSGVSARRSETMKPYDAIGALVPR